MADGERARPRPQFGGGIEICVLVEPIRNFEETRKLYARRVFGFSEIGCISWQRNSQHERRSAQLGSVPTVHALFNHGADEQK